jgi:hypothetical protein
MQQIGMIRLEGLMSRGRILFSNGFKFRGNLDVENFEAGFNAIVDQIDKFRYCLDYRTQNNCRWASLVPGSKRFLKIDSENIDEAFREFCADSVSILDKADQFPMVLALIRNKDSEKKDEFIIALLSDHTYLDNRSSTVIFHKVVAYYNAMISGDLAAAQRIAASANRLRTVSAAEMVDMLSDKSVDHRANAAALNDYPLADAGGYNIPIADIPACIERHRQERAKPRILYFDQKPLTDDCRRKFPEVTRNSVACAVLAKSVYQLNTTTRGVEKDHQITMKMVIDLLTPQLRENYIGNYIGFLPVTVNGAKSIAQIAKEIDTRVREIRLNRQDVTAFSLVERAVEQELVGTADEDISFIVTNWNNYFFLESREYLSGCRSLMHVSGVNVDPKCPVGASLINKPVAVINLSFDDQLRLSFFPSLRSQQENNDLMEQINLIFNQSYFN